MNKVIIQQLFLDCSPHICFDASRRLIELTNDTKHRKYLQQWRDTWQFNNKLTIESRSSTFRAAATAAFSQILQFSRPLILPRNLCVSMT